jgi:gluconokinase
MYPISKIIWLRDEVPEVFKHAAWFISAKEYVIFRLTGRHIVDYNIASGTGLLDTRNLVWDEISLNIAEIQPERLSVLENPHNIIGQVDARLAARMGLRNNTPIILGGADAVNSSLGTGAVHSNQLTCMVGTSGAIRVIVEQPVFDPKERIWCYAIDSTHWLVGGAINNGGLALWWLQNAFSQGKRESRLISLSSGYYCLAEQIKAGAEGVICLPFFTSKRSPNWNLNAAVFGLTLQHDQRRMRAVLEGVGFRLRSVLDVLRSYWRAREIRVVGLFTKLWVQVITDVINKNTDSAQKETSSVGAAFWALLGTKVVDRIESLSPYVNILATFQPDRDANRIYENRYMVYKDLYDSLQVLFSRSNQVD